MAENGGHTISDFIKRNTKFLFQSEQLCFSTKDALMTTC